MKKDAPTITTLLGRTLALRRVPPFDQLTEEELTLLAEVAEPRQLAAHEPAFSGDRPFTSLWVTVAGSLVFADGTAASPLNGLLGLLHSQPGEALNAGPDGAAIIVLRRGYVFTLMRECPQFVHALLTGPDLPGPHRT